MNTLVHVFDVFIHVNPDNTQSCNDYEYSKEIEEFLSNNSKRRSTLRKIRRVDDI